MWTVLYGTCFVVGLMGYTSYKVFYAADKEERELQARRQAAAAAAARKAGPAQPSLPGGAAANRVLQAAKRLAK